MTLEFLEGVKRQLETQAQQLPSTADPTKPVLMHANFIEISGALQLIAQLIAQEKLFLAAPPGATGPTV